MYRVAVVKKLPSIVYYHIAIIFFFTFGLIGFVFGQFEIAGVVRRGQYCNITDSFTCKTRLVVEKLLTQQ